MRSCRVISPARLFRYVLSLSLSNLKRERSSWDRKSLQVASSLWLLGSSRELDTRERADFLNNFIDINKEEKICPRLCWREKSTSPKLSAMKVNLFIMVTRPWEWRGIKISPRSSSFFDRHNIVLRPHTIIYDLRNHLSRHRWVILTSECIEAWREARLTACTGAKCSLLSLFEIVEACSDLRYDSLSILNHWVSTLLFM